MSHLDNDLAIKFVGVVAMTLVLFGGLGLCGYLIGLLLNLAPLSLGVNPSKAAGIGALIGLFIAVISTIYLFISEYRENKAKQLNQKEI